MGKLPEPVRILLRKCRALPFVLAFLAFVNIFYPVFSYSYYLDVKFGAQPHLGLLIFSLVLAASIAVRDDLIPSPRRRGALVLAIVVSGFALFRWNAPEKRFRRILADTRQIRVYMTDCGVRNALLVRIEDSESIGELRKALSITTRPWELAYWFTAGGDHELEFYDNDGNRIGYLRTLGGGRGLIERFDRFGRIYNWKASIPTFSDYTTASGFQQTYRRVLLEQFLTRQNAPIGMKRWYLLQSIQSDEAFAEIAADRSTANPADRVIIARWLEAPHNVCVPALIEMASDPIPEVRAQAIISLMAHDQDPRALALLTELRAHPTGDHEVDEYLQRFFERHEGSQRR